MNSIAHKIRVALLGGILIVSLFAVALLVVGQISASRNKSVVEIMTSEYEIIAQSDNLIKLYSDSVKNPEDVSLIEKYNNASKKIISDIENLKQEVVSEESKSLLLGVESSVRLVVKECDLGLEELSIENVMNTSSHFDEANKLNEFVKNNVKELLQKELEFLSDSQASNQRIYVLSLFVSIGVFGVIVLVMIIFSQSFAMSLVNPLVKLSVFAKEVAFGNIQSYRDQDLKITDDEIGSLTSSVYAMVDELVEKVAREKGVNERIEKTVIERTSELKEKNESLVKAKEEISEGWMTLQKEKAKLLGSIEAIVRAYVFLDPGGNVVVTNSKLEQFLGSTEGVWTIDKINEKLISIIDLKQKFDECLKTKSSFTLKEFSLGSKFFDLYISPVFMDKNELVGGLILIGDITEAKVLERSKDEFFSIASHELRTPLTAIRGNTSMVLDYYKDALKDPELKTMIVDTHDASVRLIGIVNDFLDVSRLEQGKMTYKTEDFDVVELAKKVIKDLDENAKTKGVELIITGNSGTKVKADMGKTEQILFNIIGNSLKFTDKGSVTVEIVANPEKSLAEIKIVDTGMGIPLANQGILFHKFQQAGSSLITRDGAKGTGLGLYISRLMAEGMGGKLELISSEEGKGSVFGVSLPSAS